MNRTPVFYDKTGKRLRRVVCLAVLLVAVVLSTAGMEAAWFVPAAIHSAQNTNSDSSLARRVLGTYANFQDYPVVGDGALQRLVRVVRDNTTSGSSLGPYPTLTAATPLELSNPPARMKLVDAVTGDYIRDPEPWEITEIGDKKLAIDSYSYVPDKTLILTFDDGPDPSWTPRILDVLARENIPATFFVIGERVVKNPEIVQRMVREGHELGNHSLTHPDLQNLPDLQRQEELVVTDRILRAVAGYDTPLFRMPMGAPNENPLTQLHSQQLGYIEVDQTLDSHDWEHADPGDVVPMPVLDGHGYVVTMHDAGGHTRVNTVTFLEKFIAQAKAQGYTFTTVSSLFPRDRQPQKDIQPTLVDRVTLFIANIRYVTAREFTNWLLTFIFVAVTAVTVFNLTLSILNEWRQRRRRWPDLPDDDEWPFVSVTLAAYNEDKVIARTLDALRASDYPASRLEVIAVNDGSTDTTLDILNNYDWPQLRVLDQSNGGKSTALNNAAKHADPRSTVAFPRNRGGISYKE